MLEPSVFSGALKEVKQFEGGQSNPTFLLTDSRGMRFVMRKKPPGKLLPRAHDVKREYTVLSALQNSKVPVPRTYVYCNDASIVGTEFYVMEYLDGRVFLNPLLPNQTPEERRKIYESMADSLARLHSVDWRKVGLEKFGRTGNYYARQISIWTRQYIASKTSEIPAMENLISWLPKNIPKDDLITLVHGDYRLGNLIFHPTEPRVIGVLDWEISTLGHPFGDLAYNCLAYYSQASTKKDPSPYQGLGGVNLAELGIPTENEYVQLYCQRISRSHIPNWNFYVAFSLFRSAAITQGVYKRGLQGNASSSRAKTMGVIAKLMAEIGWSVVKQQQKEAKL
eukprot:TRINITY_DN19846_c0_g1_i1.p1 TRINITY_DN19846_c0_g1~~TRINITY_DN19846_c0_g1_i1.p1  ORF type:complete len:338 (+),score=58.70 TRINITY_DN19846_c0_g1_i1:257-1270(+)